MLLLFLTLRKRLTQSIMISYGLNYIFIVYQVLPINVFPPIWIIILRNVLSMVPFQNVAPSSVVFPKEQY